jgi:AraC-like DNA-binding protein
MGMGPDAVVTSAGALGRALGRHHGPVRIQAAPERFSARIRNVRCDDDVLVGLVRGQGHLLERTDVMIGARTPRYVNFGLVTAGRGHVRQQGRVAAVTAGDMFLNDPDVPFAMEFGEDFGMLYVVFPRRMIELSTPEFHAITAQAVSSADALSTVVRPFLLGFERSLESLTDRTRTRLLRSTIDVIGTVAHELLDTRARQLAGRPGRLHEAIAFMEANLGDPELGPERVADALYITPRHLRGIFQREGTTVSAWIRRQRLERCRSELAEARHAHEPVAAIGRRWGFGDPSHFSRVFRAEFGEAPGRYRELAAGYPAKRGSGSPRTPSPSTT